MFLDFEGDPFAFEQGLEYLIGTVTIEDDGAPSYETLWSFDPAAEKKVHHDNRGVHDDRPSPRHDRGGKESGLHDSHDHCYPPGRRIEGEAFREMRCQLVGIVVGIHPLGEPRKDPSAEQSR